MSEAICDLGSRGGDARGSARPSVVLGRAPTSLSTRRANRLVRSFDSASVMQPPLLWRAFPSEIANRESKTANP
jgi:hypothetical protein